MHTPRQTRGFFVLEALNSLGTTYYFYYLYFFTEKEFAFTKGQNLALAAGLGLTYGISSIVGGRFAQKRGYFSALKLGLGLMCVLMASGAWVRPLLAQIVIMAAATFAMALTWPALEALVSEGESPQRLQRNIGIYNIIWAGFGAVAYFSGGALINAGGFRAMFLVPAAIQALQLAFAWRLERSGATAAWQGTGAGAHPVLEEDDREKQRSPVSPAMFLKMAWLANPFAYLAIQTVVAVIPALAQRLGLSVVWAGIICSVWLFVRTASFALLWLWDGWHYRFRWLMTAYATMALSFVAMLIAPNLAVLLIAQTLFGLSLGLIYYSSLYYSMHVGDTKGEHGGFHEAMIGAGSCAGPAVGALSLHFLPQYSSSGTVAVGVLLLGGLVGLVGMRVLNSKNQIPKTK